VSRLVTVGAAQLGPIQRADTRAEVVGRLVELLQEAAGRGCELVVFPELALTSFFPRWYLEDEVELDGFFEREMPGTDTKPLFEEAARLGVGFSLGYAERLEASDGVHRYNAQVLVERDGHIVGTYRKVHLPGHDQPEPWRAFQHLEKRYFEVGPDGFQVWRAFGGVIGMCLCNDRRWPETYRVMALQGAEMIVLGYNTPVHNPPAPDHDLLSNFHNHLVMQAGAYQNGLWVVGVAKAGDEEGVAMIGQSAIIAPSGEIAAQCTTLGDELAVATCDLDRCRSYRDTTFNFARHRQIEHYGLITTRRGEIPPPP